MSISEANHQPDQTAGQRARRTLNAFAIEDPRTRHVGHTTCCCGQQCDASVGSVLLSIGPFKFRLSISPTGEVTLPAALHDQKLSSEIADAARAAVLGELEDVFEKFGAQQRAHAGLGRAGTGQARETLQ